MLTPLIDINDHIAIVKCWSYEVVEYHVGKPFKSMFWTSPEGVHALRPNFTGTLNGVAEMLGELGSEWAWGWWHGRWFCFEKNHQTQDERGKLRSFSSRREHPGDCVGEAWLAVFEKEAIDVD